VLRPFFSSDSAKHLTFALPPHLQEEELFEK